MARASQHVRWSCIVYRVLACVRTYLLALDDLLEFALDPLRGDVSHVCAARLRGNWGRVVLASALDANCHVPVAPAATFSF